MCALGRSSIPKAEICDRERKKSWGKKGIVFSEEGQEKTAALVRCARLENLQAGETENAERVANDPSDLAAARIKE